jgi:hypothetical protein
MGGALATCHRRYNPGECMYLFKENEPIRFLEIYRFLLWQSPFCFLGDLLPWCILFVFLKFYLKSISNQTKKENSM